MYPLKCCNGGSINDAVQSANIYLLQSYATDLNSVCTPTSGSSSTMPLTRHCGMAEWSSKTMYPTKGTSVYHNGFLWLSKWLACPGEEPVINDVWTKGVACTE